MMNLLAGAFAGVAMFFGGLFGHHAPPGQGMGSTTPNHMASSTWSHGGDMGSTTPGHMGMMPGVFGKVVSVSGTTLTVSGKSGGMDAATTTYTVDASSAKVVKQGTKDATVANIAVGDMVAVQGTVSGTSVTAKNIIDGIRGMMMHPGMGGMGPMGGRMGSSTRPTPPAPPQQ